MTMIYYSQFVNIVRAFSHNLVRLLHSTRYVYASDLLTRSGCDSGNVNAALVSLLHLKHLSFKRWVARVKILFAIRLGLFVV